MERISSRQNALVRQFRDVAQGDIAVEQQRVGDVPLRDVAKLPDQRVLPARNPFHLGDDCNCDRRFLIEDC